MEQFHRNVKCSSEIAFGETEDKSKNSAFMQRNTKYELLLQIIIHSLIHSYTSDKNSKAQLRFEFKYPHSLNLHLRAEHQPCQLHLGHYYYYSYRY
jgi:hypothetical protein